ncbi:scarecrow-like protein 34 [Carex rostrata]
MGSHIHEIQGLTIDDLVQPEAFLIQNNFIPSPNEAATDSSSSSFARSSSNSNSTNSSTLSPPLSFQEQDSTDDSVIFSDFVFSYIDRMLMEEERFDGQYHPADMLATEQQFSSILGGGPTDEPPLTQFVPAQQVDLVPVQTAAIDWPSDFAHNMGDNNPYDITSNDHSLFYGDADNLINFDAFNGWQHDSVDLNQLNSQLLFANTNSFSSLSSLSPTSTVTTDANTTTSASNKTVEVGLEESMFHKGLEEAQKFLPKAAKLFIDVESTDFNVTRHEPAPQSKIQFLPTILVKEEENNSNSTKSISPEGQQRGRKHPYRDRDEVEKEDGRNNKQVAYMEEETIREMFDKVLLGGQDKCFRDIMALREAKHDEQVRIAAETQASASGNTKGRGRRKAAREVVDLRTILIHCAQAVATDDRRSANELLRQIRHYASPTGDATQRLAQCFSDGLQARLAGTGSHLYQSLVAKRTSAAELLKAYQLYMAACPFKKISFYFSNQTILDVSEGAERVHIIDFGIHYGFQWPCLLQRLSSRKGGPPHLKITGIDHPQPGFRPDERLQETGRRLSDYAAHFHVPFEYKAIAAKWETIKVENIDIDPNEVTVVNCLFKLKNLPDETVTTDSPRDVVLKLIRKINPHVFVHGIVNGSYSAPFFVTRFREALFHYSALFDMLDANVPKEDEHRLLIERDLFGRSALNVIACEGLERVERPETYKQWQVRDMRAGFKQLPLNDEIVTKAREKVKKCYHKDFVVDADHGWLLQGWKGRIVYGMSTWKARGLP